MMQDCNPSVHTGRREQSQKMGLDGPSQEAGWSFSTNIIKSLDPKALVPPNSRTERGRMQRQPGRGWVTYLCSCKCVCTCAHIFLCNFRSLLKLKDSKVPPSLHPRASDHTCDWIVSLTPKRLCLPLCLFAHVLICVCKLARIQSGVLRTPGIVYFVSETGFLLAFRLPSELVWLTSKIKGSSHLQAPSTEITNMCCCT